MDDVPIALVAGLVATALALLAWLADRRRMRRSDPDAVGFIPWRTVFFFAFLSAVLLLALAAQESLGGQGG